jgi:hypothetical protein
LRCPSPSVAWLGSTESGAGAATAAGVMWRHRIIVTYDHYAFRDHGHGSGSWLITCQLSVVQLVADQRRLKALKAPRGLGRFQLIVSSEEQEQGGTVDPSSEGMCSIRGTLKFRCVPPCLLQGETMCLREDDATELSTCLECGWMGKILCEMTIR